MRLGLLPLLFLVMPIAEISVLILVGGEIGLWPTLGLLLAAAVLGVLLLRHQGFGVLRRMEVETRAGRLPGREMAHGLAIVVAAFLLIMPGFLSDALGLLLFVPAVRNLAWRLAARRVTVMAASGTGPFRAAGRGRPFPRGPFRGAPGRPAAGSGVVDLDAEDFERRPDPASPWRANGHDAARPALRDGTDDERRPPTLH